MISEAAFRRSREEVKSEADSPDEVEEVVAEAGSEAESSEKPEA